MRSPICRQKVADLKISSRRLFSLLTTTATVGLVTLVAAEGSQVAAQTAEAKHAFSIAAQPLSQALKTFGRQSGLQITLAAETTRGVQAGPVSGQLTARQALAELLAGTGISYDIAEGTATVGRLGGANTDGGIVAGNGATVLAPITVFGAGTTGPGQITISSQELEQKNPASIADVFKGETGVSVGSSLPMSQKVYVHGIEETNLAVTIDGSRQNNKVFHHSATNLIDPSLLKTVNVDAGVAPADAGPGALGGAIAYATKDARDLLDGDGYGRFVSSSYNFNSDTVVTGLSGYAMQDGLEALGTFTFGKGNEFHAGNGDEVLGTGTDLISGIGKLAYTFASGDRISISHDRLRDDAERPFRANAGFIEGRPPWEPRVRDYALERQNTVFTYTDSTPEGWWDPKVILAYSRTSVETKIYLRPTLNILPYDGLGETGSLNGKVQNTFALANGNIVAGIDVYNDKAELDDLFDSATEKARDIGIYAQARIEPWEKTRISFGARGDQQWFTGTTGETWDHSGLSGNMSGEYDLIEDTLTAKAGYSRVWAGIPLAENFIMNPNWDYGDGPDPVRSNNANLGLATTFNDFTIEGSIFRTNIDKARAPRYAVPLGVQQRDVTSKGFEIGAGYSWNASSVKVKYADIDVEIDGQPADSELGSYLAAPAGQIFTLTAIHTFVDLGVTLGADAELALDYDDVAPGSRPYEGYQVFNAFLEYKPPTKPNLTLRADIKNVFDQTYADRATYGQEFGTVTPLYEQGRALILTAKATF
ncbi:hemoglobin/transferrin/lactoferrin receptor protein [Rhizobium sp. PP-CC-3A-592]|nr:hemoglobin/transferrin/lactoferrin receptor protein [Rhizobium sp. PP-CC-3A-592]